MSVLKSSRCFITRSDRRFLIMVREHARGANMFWISLLGGLIPPGESIEYANSQSVFQKLGIQLLDVKPLTVFKSDPSSGQFDYHYHYLTARTEDLVDLEGPVSGESFQWVNKEEFDRLRGKKNIRIEEGLEHALELFLKNK